MVRRFALLTAVLVSVASPCGAEPPLDASVVVERVQTAVRDGDTAALRALAASDVPDPWVVADMLCARGAFDAAAAFAAAAPRPDVEALPAYVAAQRGRPVDETRREAAESAREAMRAKDAKLALERLESAAGGPEDVTGARLLMTRAGALRALRRAAEAADAWEVAAQATLRLGWLSRACDSLREAGAMCWKVPDFRRGLRLSQRALELQERRGVKAGLAGALGNVGAFHDALGDSRKALEFMERALPLAEQEGRPGGVALVLGDLGVIREKLGDVDEALRLQQRSLALAEEAKDPPQVGRTLTRLGSLRHARGELEDALDLHTRAAAILEAAGRSGEAASAIESAGLVHRSRGDYARALALLQKALETARKAVDPLSEGHALASLATVHGELYDRAAAVAYREQSIRLWERAGNRPGLARGLHNLAMDFWFLGDPSRALPLIERAVAMREEIGKAADVASSETASALVLLDLGRKDDALKTVERARERAEAAGNPEILFVAWKVTGKVREVRGEPREALAAFRRASEGARRMRSSASLIDSLTGEAHAHRALGNPAEAMAVARAGQAETDIVVRGHDEEHAAGVRRRVAGLFEEGALAAATLGDGAAAVSFLEAGRAGALRETLEAGGALRASDLPEELRLAEGTARVAETAALARFTRALRGRDAELEARGAELDVARESRRDAARRIQRWAKSRGGGALPDALPAEEIRVALEPGEVLVLYAWLGEGVLAAVVRRDGVALVRLGERADLEKALRAAAPEEQDAVPQVAIDAARAAVLGPLALRPADRRVVVSPDGPLARVPFALLEAEREVVFVPSGSILALLRARKRPPGDGVLALGDPAYAAPGDAAAPSAGLPLSRLPSTGIEARAVGDVVLLGTEATEAGLRKALALRPRWRAIHLACHGLIDVDRPLLSSLALAPEGDDDGLLTGSEILRMSVPADLVVLSGCDTARGKAFRGEGVLGLSRAFLLAGAPRVIASLWKVDDDATRAFMETFYGRWKAGAPIADALRAARDRVRADPRWTHPRHWAGFVLWGLPG